MNAILDILSQWPAEHMVRAMAHTLWQGAAIAALLWMILLALPATFPNARYLAALLTLCAIPICWMFTWSLLDRRDSPLPAIVASSTATVPTNFDAPLPNQPPPIWVTSPHFISWTTVAGRIWLIGAILMLLRAAHRMARVGQMAAHGQPLLDGLVYKIAEHLREKLGIRRRIWIVTHSRWTVPAVAGLFLPTLLLPAAMLTGWSVTQVQMVLAHELAHVRRWDYLVNFWQQILEAVLFFNPALWWISRQVRIEREACCDAIAVAITGRPLDAARTLAEFAIQSQTSPALAITGCTPGSLRDRILRILRPQDRPSMAAPWYAASSGIALGLLLLCALRVGAQAAVGEAEKFLTPQEMTQVEQLQNSQTQTVFLKPEHDLHGVVKTDDGQPLPAGMEIEINCHGLGSSWGTGAALDAQGGFNSKVPAGEITLIGAVNGYAPQGIGPIPSAADGKYPDAVIPLNRGFPTRFQVRDADGKPIPNCVFIARCFQFIWQTNPPTFKTGADGIGVLKHCSAEIPLQLDVTAPGYEFQRLKLTPQKGRDEQVKLTRALPATGRIINAQTGAPLAHATVRMIARSGYESNVSGSESLWPVVATADSEGNFTLDNLRADSQYGMLAGAPGHCSEYFEFVRAGDSGLVWKLGPLHTIHGKITGDLSRLSSYTGPDGATRRWIRSSGDIKTPAVHFSTNESIKVDISGAVGTFEIPDAWLSPLTLTIGGKSVTVRSDDIPPVLEVNLDEESVARRLVVFKFIVPAGAPLPSGQLDVNSGGGIAPSHVPIINGTASYSIFAPGTLSIDSSKVIGYWLDRTESTIHIPPGDGPLEIPIPAVPAGAVHGKVLEPDGSPCRNFSVSIIETKRSPALGNSFDTRQPFQANNGNGQYLINDLPLGGRYRFAAYSGNQIMLSDEIRLGAPTSVQELNFKFPPGVFLRAVVNDTAGHPHAGVLVSLHGSWDEYDRWIGEGKSTGPDGSVLFEHINPDSGCDYNLYVAPGPDYPSSKTPVSPNGKTVALKLSKGYSIHGRALEGNVGTPLAHVQVRAFPNMLPYGENETKVWTDQDGRFEFKNLEQREYVFGVENARPPQDNRPVKPFPTAAGGQSEEVIIHAILYP